jgi:hypothetical protein
MRADLPSMTLSLIPFLGHDEFSWLNFTDRSHQAVSLCILGFSNKFLKWFSQVCFTAIPLRRSLRYLSECFPIAISYDCLKDITQRNISLQRWAVTWYSWSICPWCNIKGLPYAAGYKRKARSHNSVRIKSINSLIISRSL